MPNLIDIAQRLAERPMVALLHEERCLPERDLGSTCTRCAEACPVDAIAVGLERDTEASPAAAYGSVAKNGPAGPRIDDDACVRCGRCVTACPTAALLAIAPLDDDALLEASVRAGAAAAKRAAGFAAEEAEGQGDSIGTRDAEAQVEAPQAAVAPACAGFACERAVRAGHIDAERTVALPCLAWVDEALIVHMARAGARRILLLTAPCASCEHAKAVVDLPKTVRSAQRILDTWQLDAAASIVETVDDVAASEDEDAAGEVSRRGLFSQARSALVEAATDAASAQMDALTGRSTADAPEPEPDRRRWQLLDDLHAAGLPAGDAVVPRALAPRVDIDPERCSGCALCAGFCPTQALRKAGKAPGGRTLLEFERLAATNFDQTSGYGTDEVCAAARERIREACACPHANVYFLVGGTQANAAVADQILRPWEGIVSATTGHITAHEAGAVEACGRKTLPLPHVDGKLVAADVRALCEAYWGDENREHIVAPGAVYISHPTEYGTVYSLAELEALAQVCRDFDMRLFMDGARLGYGLAAVGADVTLADIARLCDAFYIGGTKVGAFCGEAVVFTKPGLDDHFFTLMKKRGALLAKGRFLGLQFDVLFGQEDGELRYQRIGRHAVELAQRIAEGFRAKDYELAIDSPTNQQFVILDDETKERLAEHASFGFWERTPDGRTVVRFATSWATRPESVNELLALL